MSGKFVFTVYFKKMPGNGFEQPTKVTLEETKDNKTATTNTTGVTVNNSTSANNTTKV